MQARSAGRFDVGRSLVEIGQASGTKCGCKPGRFRSRSLDLDPDLITCNRDGNSTEAEVPSRWEEQHKRMAVLYDDGQWLEPLPREETESIKYSESGLSSLSLSSMLPAAGAHKATARPSNPSMVPATVIVGWREHRCLSALANLLPHSRLQQRLVGK